MITIMHGEVDKKTHSRVLPGRTKTEARNTGHHSATDTANPGTLAPALATARLEALGSKSLLSLPWAQAREFRPLNPEI